ncbi:MAG: hypothetical protein HY226_04590 [Candidatus Vogelbacteria bacterium]|nr:hypothetical protein [Candidatus Vogelbacteria bacterium]
MNNNLTKTLIVIVVALIIILSGFGLYKYIYNRSSTTSNLDNASTTSAFPQSPDISGQYGSDSNTTITNTNKATNGRNTQSSISSSVAGFDVKIVSDKPVSGYYFIEKQDPDNKEPKLYLRYSERESGHLYEIAYNENIPREISNTTITRVYESYHNNLGNILLYRRLDENNQVQNILAKLGEGLISTSTDNILASTVGKLNQIPFQADIREVAISPNRDKIFYLTAAGDNFIGTIDNFSDKAGGKKQIFSSPLGEWLVQWPKDNTLFFNTKAAAGVPGYLFSVDVSKQDFTKIIGDINGLTTNIGPDLKKLIYSESTNGFVTTYLYDLTRNDKYLLPIKTLPEKCVWGGIDDNLLYCAVPVSPNNNDYPDSWYQGTESFNDEIWVINLLTGQTNIIADQNSLGRNTTVDATNLQLSPKENYLSFINKKDQSLWLVKIK